MTTERWPQRMLDALEQLSKLQRSEMRSMLGEGARYVMIELANTKVDALIVAPRLLHAEWKKDLTILHDIITPHYLLKNKVDARGLFVLVDVHCHHQSAGQMGRAMRTILATCAGFCIRTEGAWGVIERRQ